jgi:hypothetical protein
MPITLEYSGTRKSLAYWGIALDSPVLQEYNLAASVLQFTRLGDAITDAAVFPYRGKIILRVGETGSDATSWTGGTVDFIGYRLRQLTQSTGSGAGVTYSFANAWHFLEQTPYVQFFTSRDTDGEVLFTKQVPELLLFQRLDETNAIEARTSGEQIADILQFVIDAFAAQGMAQPFIIGTIDPALQLPSYQARQLMCAAAILKCLELSPDVNSHWDYTTSVSTVPTPTIHFLSRGSQTAASLAIHNGTDHKSLAIEPRPDLKPRSVVVTYKRTGSDSGSLWIQYLTDKYGPNGQSHASDPDYGLDVLTQFIDIQGRQTNSVSADVTTQVVNAAHATDATRLAWWRQKYPTLASDKISGLAISAGSVTVKDAAGTTVSLATYPNELIGQPLPPWTGKTTKWVTIIAKASYNTYANAAAATAATANLLTKKHEEKEISVRLQVTDATTTVYNTSSEVADGETIPGLTGVVDGVGTFSNGLAKKIWDALNVDQFEGEDVRIAAEPSNAINFSKKLNLTGGLTAWATMAAQLQTIRKHYGLGETSVSFGPTKHNNADALNQLIQWSRPRFVWFNPAMQETGQVSGGDGPIEAGGEVPKENTSAGSGTNPQWGAQFKFTE